MASVLFQSVLKQKKCVKTKHKKCAKFGDMQNNTLFFSVHTCNRRTHTYNRHACMYVMWIILIMHRRWQIISKSLDLYVCVLHGA